jgi:hypothetical protein
VLPSTVRVRSCFDGMRDGQPEGQGATIFKFLRVITNIEKLKTGIKNIFPAKENQLCTYRQKADQWERKHDGNGLAKLYPTLSGRTGAKILKLIANATATHKIPVSQSLKHATVASGNM